MAGEVLWKGEPYSAQPPYSTCFLFGAGPGSGLETIVTGSVIGPWALCPVSDTDGERSMGCIHTAKESLETSRKQDSLSSFFCFLVPVLGGISIYSSLHSSGLSPHAS